MYVKNLQLKNFRNYKKLNIDLSDGVNIFIGDNAQGKTNILESIYYCSLGKSNRTNKDKELITWDSAEAFIKIDVSKKRLDKKVEIKIFKEGKKGIKINSIKINKISELVGAFNVVMFSPEDLRIVKDSPSFRRAFLDIELCKLNAKYYYNLVQYNKVINEKNIVLRSWSGQNMDILDVYDEQLTDFSSYIVKERKNYIHKLNEYGKIVHKRITSEIEDINFEYITSVKETKEDMLELLLKNRQRDIFKKYSSVGPHKDDILITINGIDVRSFGSQGQQRTSVLTIKFASIDIIKDITDEFPVLLLDDVLSELDFKRQKFILNSINGIQTVITCTGMDRIKECIEKDTRIFTVKNGEVELS